MKTTKALMIVLTLLVLMTGVIGAESSGTDMLILYQYTPLTLGPSSMYQIRFYEDGLIKEVNVWINIGSERHKPGDFLPSDIREWRRVVEYSPHRRYVVEREGDVVRELEVKDGTKELVREIRKESSPEGTFLIIDNSFRVKYGEEGFQVLTEKGRRVSFPSDQEIIFVVPGREREIWRFGEDGRLQEVILEWLGERYSYNISYTDNLLDIEVPSMGDPAPYSEKVVALLPEEPMRFPLDVGIMNYFIDWRGAYLFKPLFLKGW